MPEPYEILRGGMRFLNREGYIEQADFESETWRPETFARARKLASEYKKELGDNGYLPSMWPTVAGYKLWYDQFVNRPKQIAVEDGYYVITGPPPTAEAQAALYAMPGRTFDKEKRRVLVKISPASAVEVVRFALDHSYRFPEIEAARKIAVRAKLIEVEGKQAMGKAIPRLRRRIKLKPFKFQWQDIRWGDLALEPNHGILLGNVTGIGKTISAAGIAEMGRKSRKKRRWLVVCPSNAKRKWVKDLRRLLPQRTIGSLGRFGDGNLDADFVVINYEALRYYLPKLDDKVARNRRLHGNPESEVQQYANLLNVQWDGIIVDECQRIKNRTSQRTRYTRKLIMWGKEIPLRIFTSGTPIVNRMAEWVVPLELLNRLSEFGGYERFMQDYVYSEDEQRALWFNIFARRSFYRRMDRHDQHLADGSVVKGVNPQLPKLLVALQTLDELTNMREYKRADDAFVEWLMESTGKPVMQTKAMAIRKITALRKLIAMGKLESVGGWIDDFMEDNADDKLILFCHHRFLQEMLSLRYPNAARLLGGQNDRTRQVNEERFQTDPECRLVICSIGAVREAIDLTAASNIAFAELGWTWMEHEQGAGRAFGRVNDPHGATAHFLVTPGTIEEFLMNLIDRKRIITTAGQAGYSVPREDLLMSLLYAYGAGKAA